MVALCKIADQCQIVLEIHKLLCLSSCCSVVCVWSSQRFSRWPLTLEMKTVEYLNKSAPVWQDKIGYLGVKNNKAHYTQVWRILSTIYDFIYLFCISLLQLKQQGKGRKEDNWRNILKHIQSITQKTKFVLIFTKIQSDY